MVTTTLKCQKCESDDVLGHEVAEVYDGILFWSCLNCGHAWLSTSATGHRGEVAAHMVDAWNKAKIKPKEWANEREAAEVKPCPECVQGKHANCGGQTWDTIKDEPVPCPCAEAGH